MCSPLGLVGTATGINTLDETRERVGGWFGQGRLADKNQKNPTSVTNNYYNKTGNDFAETKTPNKDTLKAGKK